MGRSAMEEALLAQGQRMAKLAPPPIEPAPATEKQPEEPAAQPEEPAAPLPRWSGEEHQQGVVQPEEPAAHLPRWSGEGALPKPAETALMDRLSQAVAEQLGHDEDAKMSGWAHSRPLDDQSAHRLALDPQIAVVGPDFQTFVSKSTYYDEAFEVETDDEEDDVVEQKKQPAAPPAIGAPAA